mgnify:FL=1
MPSIRLDCYSRRMRATRWAILGPGTISADFAQSLQQSEHGILHAVASSNAERAAHFARNHGVALSGSYESVLDRDDVDAVYIGTVHTTHAELAIAALSAGKAVLCEKPISPTLDETLRVLKAARDAHVPFVEAFKYRFGPLAATLRDLIATGEIGDIQKLEAGFGFTAEHREGRLFDPQLAGGAILDAGAYPASLAVGIATWAPHGTRQPGPRRLSVTSGEGEIGSTGVDEWATAKVSSGDFAASIRTSIVADLPRACTIVGTRGTIEVSNVWGSRHESAAELILNPSGRPAQTMSFATVDPMAAEADAVSLALDDGRVEIPEMPWADSIATAELLGQWRASLN